MKRALLAGGLVVALAAPAASAVAKPTKTDRENAAAECRTERGNTHSSREAFRAKYGTNKKGRNAFGKCVSRRSRDEEKERASAAANAAKACKAERADIGTAPFAEKYGTNKNKNNAFGKCVSGKAKTLKAEADAKDRTAAKARKSAAKECATERKDTGRAAFADKYGTNKSKKNAFGKCVSGKAKAKVKAGS